MVVAANALPARQHLQVKTAKAHRKAKAHVVVVSVAIHAKALSPVTTPKPWSRVALARLKTANALSTKSAWIRMASPAAVAKVLTARASALRVTIHVAPTPNKAAAMVTVTKRPANPVSHAHRVSNASSANHASLVSLAHRASLSTMTTTALMIASHAPMHTWAPSWTDLLRVLPATTQAANLTPHAPASI